jgi:hypothetical protein
MRVPALLAVFVLSLFPCVLSAQSTNASLTVPVRDPSKARGQWIFSGNRYAAKLYSMPYTWRCNRATTDEDVFVTARRLIGRP